MSPAEEFRYLILAAQREGNRIYADLLKPEALTPAQAEAIITIDDAASLSLRQLGSRLVCEMGSPSRLVDTLVLSGLVKREQDPGDRRSVILSLTDAGKDAAGRARAAEAVLHATIVAAVDARRMAAASDVLRALVDGRPAGEAIEEKKAAASRPR